MRGWAGWTSTSVTVSTIKHGDFTSLHGTSTTKSAGNLSQQTAPTSYPLWTSSKGGTSRRKPTASLLNPTEQYEIGFSHHYQMGRHDSDTWNSHKEKELFDCHLLNHSPSLINEETKQ